jgi:hypothetical protein
VGSVDDEQWRVVLSFEELEDLREIRRLNGFSGISLDKSNLDERDR